MKKHVKSSSVGKIILMGEHSVVYGKPAIAIPYPGAQVEVTIEESPGPVFIESKLYEGKLEEIPDIMAGIKEVIIKISQDLAQEAYGFKIRIDSSVPYQRGMGSSAAVASATSKALFKYFNREIEKKEIKKYTDLSEKIIHGNPSGLDAATIIGEKAIYYIKGQGFREIEFYTSGYLIVADTGIKGRTKDAVDHIFSLYQEKHEATNELIEELGSLAEKSCQDLEKNDLPSLGKKMTQAHQILKKLGVSHEKLDALVKEALDYNALGAKLTGGGRGGSMIVLVRNKEDAQTISSQLMKVGARQTWISKLGEKND